MPADSCSEHMKEGTFVYGYDDRIDSKLLGSLKRIEKIGCMFGNFGKLYGKCFYQDMIKKELEMADISEGARVLVIGSGPLPCTGIYLAKKGFDVLCIDNDREAIKTAQELVEGLDVADNIRFELCDGRDMDYHDQDAIWLTFSVEPKYEIIKKILDEIDKGGKVIYRNPRGQVKRFYSTVEPDNFSHRCNCIPQSFGKQSVVLVKDSEGGGRNMTLNCLNPGEEATICSCPEYPFLSALGLRPGKIVRAVNKQPFGGPLLASVDGRKLALDRDIAENILLL